jgi:hypothetical protein
MSASPLFQAIDAVTIPVPDLGRLAVVADPFGDTLVVLDLCKGHYVTDAAGNVTAVTRSAVAGSG